MQCLILEKYSYMHDCVSSSSVIITYIAACFKLTPQVSKCGGKQYPAESNTLSKVLSLRKPYCWNNILVKAFS